MSEDSFIREVEEDLRRDQMKALWNRFGNIVIAAAVLVVLATAGFRGYAYWSGQQAAKSGDAYLEAVELSQTGKQDDAVKALEELAKSGTGQYPALARLRLAGEIQAKGDRAAALAAFDAIAADSAFDDAFRSVAKLRAGLLAVDLETYDQVKARLEPMATAASPSVPWRAKRSACRHGRPAQTKTRQVVPPGKRGCRFDRGCPRARRADAGPARRQWSFGGKLSRLAMGPR